MRNWLPLIVNVERGEVRHLHDCGDERCQQIFDERGDDRAERAADDDGDGQVDDVATEEKLLESLQHDARSIRLRDTNAAVSDTGRIEHRLRYTVDPEVPLDSRIGQRHRFERRQKKPGRHQAEG